MRPVVVSLTGSGAGVTNSAPVPLDRFQNPFNIGLGFKTTGATTVFKVQYTFDNPADYADATAFNANATWYDHPYMVTMTAGNSGNIAFAVSAVRLQASAAGTNTGTLTVIQSGAGIG